MNRFMIQYVYIPLGGGRKGNARACLNILIVFFVSGVWHGAAWGFIVWGMINGVLCVLTRIANKYLNNIPKIIKQTVTILSISFSWIFFRASSVTEACQMLKQIGQCHFGNINQNLTKNMNLDEFWYLMKILHLDQRPYSNAYIAIGFLAVSLFIVFVMKNANQLVENFKPRLWNAIALSVLLVWCVISFSGVSTFLYFNF